MATHHLELWPVHSLSFLSIFNGILEFAYIEKFPYYSGRSGENTLCRSLWSIVALHYKMVQFPHSSSSGIDHSGSCFPNSCRSQS